MNPHANNNQNESQGDVSFATLEYLIEQRKDAEVITMLDATPSLLSFVDTSSQTLLHAATKHKNSTIVEYLMKGGCDIEAKTSSGSTPLLIAADLDDAALVKMLLGYDADIFATNAEGKSALQIYLNSLNSDRLPVLEEIFEKLMNKNMNNQDLFTIFETGKCSLIELVHLRNTELTKMYLDKQADYYDYLDPDEVFNNHPELNLPTDDFFLTHRAVYTCMKLGYVENLKAILQHGVNVKYNRDFFIVLFPAFVSKCDKASLKHINKYVQLLIDLYIINSENISDINKMFLKANQKSLGELLKTNLNSFMKSKFGYEPLKYVFGNPNPGILKLIQREQLDVQFREEALHNAVFYKVEEHIRYLLEKNFDPNTTINGILTPIFYTFGFKVHPNNNSCLRLLLQYNADIQVYARNGSTFISRAGYRVEDKRTFETTVAHLALLQSCKISIKAEFIDFINSHENLIKFYDNVCRQLEQMKKHKIHRSLALFTVLTQNCEIISHRVKAMNLDTAKTLCSSADDKLVEYNDYYTDIIRDRLMLAYKICATRKAAADVIYDCIDQLKGQLLVVDKICSFISYKHLHKIVYPSHEMDCKECKISNLHHYQFVKASQASVE